MKNKNVVKKITAILATACMMVGMLATTAMAKPATAGKTGSLTIQAKTTTTTSQSTLKDYEFNLYKVASITINSSGEMNYTAESAYESTLNAIELKDQTAVEANLEALSKVTGVAAVASRKVDTEVTSTKFENLALGYYLVKVTAPKGAAATKDFLVSVPSTLADGSDLNYDPTVILKTSTVDATKTGAILDGERETTNKSGNIGDTIKYKIDTHVPDTTGFVKYTYTITDTMSKGLKFVDGSLTVSMDVNNAAQTIDSNNYEFKKTDNTDGTTTIVVAFKDTLFVGANKQGNNSSYPAGSPLHIVYKAKITEDAIANGSTVNNKADLTYSNNPGTDGIGTTDKIPTNEVKHYIYHIQLNKKFNPTSDQFSSVKFTLDNVKLRLKTGSTVGEYVVDPDNGIVDLPLSLNDKGELKIYGLKESTYYLNETKTAEGYNLLKDKVKVVIEATYDQTTGEPNGNTQISNTIDLTSHFVTTEVVNKKGFTLPSTGGQGMVALVAAGICLMTLMAALMALYMKKHRNA